MTKIEWADRTWNPIIGCTKCSPGCEHCYAERMAVRMAANPYAPREYSEVVEGGKWNGHIVDVTSTVGKPLLWRKPSRIFVCSMSDMFHEHALPETWDEIMVTAALCPQHTFMILTKRPERMQRYMSGGIQEYHTTLDVLERRFRGAGDTRAAGYIESMWDHVPQWPLPNVWTGVTVENQDQADARIPALLETPAAKWFVSVEPMLGEVNFRWASWTQWWPVRTNHLDGLRLLDWVICGGETGPGARPMHPGWVRMLRDQCVEAGVPFFFKGWGDWIPQSQEAAASIDPDDWLHMRHGALHRDGRWLHGVDVSMGEMADGWSNLAKVGKKRSGHLLDGVAWQQFPEAK